MVGWSMVEVCATYRERKPVVTPLLSGRMKPSKMALQLVNRNRRMILSYATRDVYVCTYVYTKYTLPQRRIRTYGCYRTVSNCENRSQEPQTQHLNFYFYFLREGIGLYRPQFAGRGIFAPCGSFICLLLERQNLKFKSR